MGIRKAVILAAGKGTRLYPLTRAIPKEMLPVLDKPVIHYVVEEAVRSGLDEILIVVGKGKEAIINYFDKHELDKNMDEYGLGNLPEIFFVRQRDQLGTADGVRYAEKFVGGEPFVVLFGDMLYSAGNSPVPMQLINALSARKGSVAAIAEAPREQVQNYGIISGKELDPHTWQISGIVEKPRPEDAPTNLWLTGAFALEPEIFECIRKTEAHENGEYFFTDALMMLAKEGKLFGYKFDGTVYDTGTKALWIKAFMEFAARSGFTISSDNHVRNNRMRGE